MPIYEYACNCCGATQEHLLRSEERTWFTAGCKEGQHIAKDGPYKGLPMCCGGSVSWIGLSVPNIGRTHAFGNRSTSLPTTRARPVPEEGFWQSHEALR